MNLNPSAGTLIFSWRFDPLVWAVAFAVLGVYLWQFVRARRNPVSRDLWPAWRAVLFVLGWLAALFALQSSAASYTLNSMALYMGRLMLLAELAPPLLVLGLPSGLIRPNPGSVMGRVLSFLLDPFVAFGVWTTIIVFWNLPIGFNASLVSATTGGLLPLLYLGGGLLVWAVTLNALPFVRETRARGWFGFLGALPMMAVSAVWLYSPTLLYSPYASVPCLWNLTPLQNQQLSGFVMMLASMPALLLALIQIFAWLLRLADQGTAVEEDAGETATDGGA